MKTRVLIIDDHPVVLAGTECILKADPDMELMGLATDSTEAETLLRARRVDVVVTDFSMPKGRYGDGATWLRFLQRRFASLKIVVMTGIESSIVVASIRETGVECIVGKVDPEVHLLPAIRAAQRGERYLSPAIESFINEAKSAAWYEGAECLSKRESEILRMFAEGLSVAQIAERVGRSSKTISSQKQSAMRKLGLSTDGHVYQYAVRHGIVKASQIAKGVISTDFSED